MPSERVGEARVWTVPLISTSSLTYEGQAGMRWAKEGARALRIAHRT